MTQCRIDPIAYVQVALALNEFLAPRWINLAVGDSTVSNYVLSSRGLPQSSEHTSHLMQATALANCACAV